MQSFRKVAFLLLGVIACTSVCANTIDELKTDEQVNAFLHSKEVRLNDYTITPLKSLYGDTNASRVAEQYGVKPWNKADIDHNGKTDLVILASRGEHSYGELIAILSRGTSFDVVKQNRERNYWPSYPVVQNIREHDCIVITRECDMCLYKFESDTLFAGGDTIIHESMTKPMLVDTIVYAFGGFIEANLDVQPHHIESIRYSTEPCYGTCPIYELLIDSSLKITYQPHGYNKRNDSLTTTLRRSAYDSIVNLLNYLDFPHLQENYSVNWTDDTGCSLIITYDGGKVKKIHDYGELGTSGLILLYQQFARLHSELDAD